MRLLRSASRTQSLRRRSNEVMHESDCVSRLAVMSCSRSCSLLLVQAPLPLSRIGHPQALSARGNADDGLDTLTSVEPGLELEDLPPYVGSPRCPAAAPRGARPRFESG